MTNTTSGDPTQAVAVLGLPHLARTLSEAGLRVVAGDTFRAGAAAANAQLKVAPIPLILADVAVAGTLPWVEKVARLYPTVMVGVDLAASETRIGGNTAQATRAPAPVSVDELLASVGLVPLGTGAVLTADGQVTASTPLPLPHPASVPTDDWGIDEFESAAPVPPRPAAVAPMAPRPRAAIAPSPVVPVAMPARPAGDFWGPGAAAPRHTAPAPVIAPQYVAPAVDAPAPAQAPYSFTTAAPAVSPYEAAPVDPPGPQPAPAQYFAPVEELASAAAPYSFDPPAPIEHVEPAPVSNQPRAFLAPVAATQVVPLAPRAAVVEQVGVETSYSPTLGRRLAHVVFTGAGKGGVGKTTIALALAQRAAVTGTLKVVLIDGNRGQGDLRTYLSLNKAGLPTVFDAITSGDPATAIVTPDRLNANRPGGAEALAFALVQAPPHGLADPTVITAGLYHDVITAARSISDLVVIDTQIVEGAERGMFDELIIPMLAAHGHFLGIADLSRPGVDNLVTHLKEFIAQGVPVARLMTMLNRVPVTTEFDLQRTSDALSQYGQFLASIAADADVHAAMAYGTSIQDNPALAPVLDAVLLRVTANPVFAQQEAEARRAPKKRGGFFRRARA